MLRALVLHGQQIDIALPGDIKYMSVPANELFLPSLKTVSVNRASQIKSLYNIHILSNALPASFRQHTGHGAHDDQVPAEENQLPHQIIGNLVIRVEIFVSILCLSRCAADDTGFIAQLYFLCHNGRNHLVPVIQPDDA